MSLIYALPGARRLRGLARAVAEVPGQQLQAASCGGSVGAHPYREDLLLAQQFAALVVPDEHAQGVFAGWER